MSARSGIRRSTLAVAPGTGDGLADRTCGGVDAQAVSDTGGARYRHPQKTSGRNIYSCDRDNGVTACGGRNPIWVQPDSSYVVSGRGNLDVVPDAGSLLASAGEYEGVQGT